MTKLLASTGKFTDTVNQVMKHVRKPVFVDNAVHHALVESQSDYKHKVTIENRTILREWCDIIHLNPSYVDVQR